MRLSPARTLALTLLATSLAVSACDQQAIEDVLTGDGTTTTAVTPPGDGEVTTTTAPTRPGDDDDDDEATTTTAGPDEGDGESDGDGTGGGGSGGGLGGGSEAADDGHPDGATLVLSDEFNGTTLDRGIWCTRYVYGGGPSLQSGYGDDECTRPNGMGTLHTLSGNGEGQIYLDENTEGQELHVVSDGHLALTATHTAAPSERQYGIEYESAMIRSKEEFRPTASTSYYLVSRVRLPDVQGTWPAWWLNPGFGSNNDPGWPPEIDIIEAPLNNRLGGGEGPDTFFVNLHGGTRGEWYDDEGGLFDRTNNHYAPGVDIRNQWLTVGFTWTEDSVCWEVAGPADTALRPVTCAAYQWGDANPASVLFNLAVGGWGAERDNSRVDPTDFPGIGAGDPVSFDIDWIRVYEVAG